MIYTDPIDGPIASLKKLPPRPCGTDLEFLHDNALWIIMDPWYPSPYPGDVEADPDINKRSDVMVKKIVEYLPNLKHVKVSCPELFDIHPDLAHIENYPNASHNQPTFANLKIAQYLMDNDICDIVYIGFHLGRCILNKDSGAKMMRRHNAVCWQYDPLVARLINDDEKRKLEISSNWLYVIDSDLTDYMPDDPLLQLITDVEPGMYLNRMADMQENIDLVRREFAEKPEVCHKLVEHIIYLRRNVDTDHHWAEFNNLIENYLDVLIKEYDVRWMLSILDTMVDYGTPVQKATAMTVVAFTKSIAISFSLLDSAMDGKLDIDKIKSGFKSGDIVKRPTVEGLSSCDVYNGDTLSYLNKRLNATAELDPTVDAIWREIKSRLKENQQLPLYWLCAYHTIKESQRFFR